MLLAALDQRKGKRTRAALDQQAGSNDRKMESAVPWLYFWYFNQNRVAWVPIPGSKLSKRGTQFGLLPNSNIIFSDADGILSVSSGQAPLFMDGVLGIVFFDEGKESGGYSSGQDRLALLEGKECPQGRKRKVA